LKKSRIQDLLERLAGQPAPFEREVPKEALRVFERGRGRLGYSQLNELLLLFGFDRITHAFFKFLLDGSTEYKPGDAFSSLERLDEGVRRFRKIAILLYGNVKFAFKTLSRDVDMLASDISRLTPLPTSAFVTRHSAILPVHPIPAREAYLTGYLIEQKLAERLRNPRDTEAVALEDKRRRTVELAKANHEAYLASDHLDVYVATSMREAHEFRVVKDVTDSIFHHKLLQPLKLRWFDPTQAYCVKRIDKGLAEGLMLRRATCTLYLAQENDTLGKDSELASTLAQGKPVIAYIPTVDDKYVERHLKLMEAMRPKDDIRVIMLEQLKLFEPSAAWDDDRVRAWCKAPSKANLGEVRRRLGQRMKSHYESRARTLKESHPLGIQVNLATGVANGVLVVRSVTDCAGLIRRIVTRSLEVDLEDEEGYTVLREKISACIFRVMTADTMLTNTFWNFYLDPAE
jgi:hypothetical protein